jgi:hypothetical protein
MTTAGGQRDETFTARYQVTPRVTRQALWFAAGEWAPVFIGLALLTLICATWSAFGRAGRVFAFVIPALALLLVLSAVERARKAAEPYRDQDLTITFDAAGFSFESSLGRSSMPWAAFRRIVRGRSGWVFYTRTRRSFFIPTTAIAPEARAFVARWAAAAGARLS